MVYVRAREGVREHRFGPGWGLGRLGAAPLFTTRTVGSRDVEIREIFLVHSEAQVCVL